MVKQRDLRLLQVLSDHAGEEMTALEIYMELDKRYGTRAGFKSASAVGTVLIRYKKAIRKAHGKNVYKL